MYENDNIVQKDYSSYYKVFTTYKEAKLYQGYLQQQENQKRLVFEQKQITDETAALRKAVKEQNRFNNQQPSFSVYSFYWPGISLMVITCLALSVSV